MWDAAVANPADLNGYDPLIKAIGDAAKEFVKPVLMLVGDSHIFLVDHPYDGSLNGKHPGIVTPLAPNLTRIIVEGSTTVPNRFEYVRLTVDPRAPGLFSWERVDYQFD